MRLVIEHVSLPKDGEVENGDLAVVRPIDGGTLLAVIDGLGHGSEAARASRQAAEALQTIPSAVEGGVTGVIGVLHERLRGGRGAAGLVCVVRGTTLEGCGVGNVDLRVLGARISVILTPGVLGSAHRRLRLFGGEITAGTRMVMFTDGISSRLELNSIASLTPAAACQTLMQRHRRGYDDATVLVADVPR